MALFGKKEPGPELLFNFDWANATATCYVCDGCGYIHWFLPRR